MPLPSNSVRDIEMYVAEQQAAPVFFAPFTVATKPTSSRWRFKGVFITDTSRPAWMDSTDTWRYADGSAV